MYQAQRGRPMFGVLKDFDAPEILRRQPATCGHNFVGGKGSVPNVKKNYMRLLQMQRKRRYQATSLSAEVTG
jgi:hypothetical protein